MTDVSTDIEEAAVSETDPSRPALSRQAAFEFAQRWQNATSEQQDAQNFWREFIMNVCGVSDLREAGVVFEKKVLGAKTERTDNRIDVYWQDTFLVEHKSAGRDLDAAETQARNYITNLPPSQRPPVIIVSDFARFRIVEYLAGTSVEFDLKDLPEQLSRIDGIISKNTKGIATVEVNADQKAAQLMADLYKEMSANGYEGHETSVFLIRILFAFFADDTRMWQKNLFQDFLLDTQEDGRDVGARIQALFDLLDTPRDKRPKFVDEKLQDFPYVNGGLFSEQLPMFYFTSGMRRALLNAAAYDWSNINTTIFGSLFQSIKSKTDRRELGQHYTTEPYINRILMPVLFDELNAKLEAAWDSIPRLKALKVELGQYQILDPAAGSGNFLILAYKHLRQLEIDIIIRLKQLEGTVGQVGLLDATFDLSVSLEQIHGIEYEEWSSQIASVALLLTDHQMNLLLEDHTGYAPDRFPLTHSAKILHGNALRTDWAELCPIGDHTIIVGNPPFVGASWQSAEQKEDQSVIWAGIPRGGDIDYVANWHLLAARLTVGTKARVAFVSTNSITQGQAPPTIWSVLYSLGVGIDFAHRTFIWESDASGRAAVHCVIIGFSHNAKPPTRPLWTYEKGSGEPTLAQAKNINAYLLDAPDVLVKSRTTPLVAHVPPMSKGSQPTDGGFLSSIDENEVSEIKEKDPLAAKYLRKLVGGQEFIQGKSRYCLWLVGADPLDIKNSTELTRRLQGVREMRLSSPKKTTQRDADKPGLFQEIRQPSEAFIAVPEVSSEGRNYVPIDLFDEQVVPTNKVQVIQGGKLSLFAILTSSLFTEWVKAISGRLKSDFSISSEITYNNFPFPLLSTEQEATLTATAQAILDARALYPTSSLATLNSPLTMPAELLKAHKANDKAVLSTMGLKASATETQMLAVLFAEYDRLTDNRLV